MQGNTALPRGKIDSTKEELKKKIAEDKGKRHENTYHNTKYSKYYGSDAWKKLRASYIETHPLCENHLRYDIYKNAEEIHHRKIWSTGATQEEKWNLLLDPSNLCALCRDCHKEFHRIARERGLTYIDKCTPIELRDY